MIAASNLAIPIVSSSTIPSRLPPLRSNRCATGWRSESAPERLRSFAPVMPFRRQLSLRSEVLAHVAYCTRNRTDIVAPVLMVFPDARSPMFRNHVTYFPDIHYCPAAWSRKCMLQGRGHVWSMCNADVAGDSWPFVCFVCIVEDFRVSGLSL